MRLPQLQAVDGDARIDRQIGHTVMSQGNRVRLQRVADHARADAQLQGCTSKRGQA